MRSIKHTIKCPLMGYEALELTFELGLRDAQLERRREQGNFCPALLDMPNWDEAAPVLELFTLDPETGELTETPMDKPEFPLTAESLMLLPTALQVRLLGDGAMNEAAADYIRTHRPN